MSGGGRVQVLVTDSGAFIKGVPLHEWSDQVVTVREVVGEIKDANTRRRLMLLPYKLVFREPTQLAIRHVTEFSKKTGDYHSLSAVDLQLIALTYQLECELGPEGGKQLRKEPVKSKATEAFQMREKSIGSTVISGFYVGKQNITAGSQQLNTEKEPTRSHDTPSLSHDIPSQDITDQQQPCRNITSTNTGLPDENADHLFPPLNGSSAGVDEGEKSSNNSDLLTPLIDQLEVSKKERENEEENEKEGVGVQGDDSEGWITPENFQQVCDELGGVKEVCPDGVTVCCVTADYAMQNVLMQMGLNVLSMEGMLIRELRTYALKCTACFKTTLRTAEQFCPHCGNKTLVKVLSHVGQDGSIQYHLLSEKQLYPRRRNIQTPPRPKGGRHPPTRIHAPDVKITFSLPRSRDNKANPLDPEYVARSSPFRCHDVTSKGAQVMFGMKRARGKVIQRRKK